MKSKAKTVAIAGVLAITIAGISFVLMRPDDNGAKQKLTSSSTSKTQAIEGAKSMAATSFRIEGAWRCRHSKSSPPGYFDRTYFFGDDGVYVTAGQDGDLTIHAVGLYATGGDQLRWIEGLHRALSSQGALVSDWALARPGGELMRSNFRDRLSQLNVASPEQLTIHPLQISTGPGGRAEMPNPPNDVPCSRVSSTELEALWKEVPRNLAKQILARYPSNPFVANESSSNSPNGSYSTEKQVAQTTGKSPDSLERCVAGHVQQLRSELISRGTPEDEIMIKFDVLEEFEAKCRNPSGVGQQGAAAAPQQDPVAQAESALAAKFEQLQAAMQAAATSTRRACTHGIAPSLEKQAANAEKTLSESKNFRRGSKEYMMILNVTTFIADRAIADAKRDGCF